MSILAVFPQKITEFSAGDSCMIDGIHMTGDDSGIRCSLTYIQNILGSHDETPKPHQLCTTDIEHNNVRVIPFQRLLAPL